MEEVRSPAAYARRRGTDARSLSAGSHGGSDRSTAPIPRLPISPDLSKTLSQRQFRLTRSHGNVSRQELRPERGQERLGRTQTDGEYRESQRSRRGRQDGSVGRTLPFLSLLHPSPLLFLSPAPRPPVDDVNPSPFDFPLLALLRQQLLLRPFALFDALVSAFDGGKLGPRLLVPPGPARLILVPRLLPSTNPLPLLLGQLAASALARVKRAKGQGPHDDPLDVVPLWRGVVLRRFARAPASRSSGELDRRANADSIAEQSDEPARERRRDDEPCDSACERSRGGSDDPSTQGRARHVDAWNRTPTSNSRHYSSLPQLPLAPSRPPRQRCREPLARLPLPRFSWTDDEQEPELELGQLERADVYSVGRGAGSEGEAGEGGEGGGRSEGEGEEEAVLLWGAGGVGFGVTSHLHCIFSSFDPAQERCRRRRHRERSCEGLGRFVDLASARLSSSSLDPTQLASPAQVRANMQGFNKVRPSQLESPAPARAPADLRPSPSTILPTSIPRREG